MGAAQMVLDAGVPVVMVPLEVKKRVSSLAKSKFVAMCAGLFTFFEKTYREVFGFESPPLHDPCAVAYVVNPALFEERKMRVDVELQSALCAGQTVCDVWNSTGKEPNCSVTVKMDVDGFWDLMVAALRRANGVSRS